jgi:crossover junction endodeoxyribonuclease RusA
MNRLTLPYPPSTNRMWRRVGNRTVLSEEAKEFKRWVRVIARHEGVVAPLASPVALSITLHPPTKTKTGRKAGPGIDLSNSIKCAEDALQGIAYMNDSQVAEITARRGEPVDGGKLVVEWRAL